MPSYKKAINFDLDTKQLEKYYPTPSYTHAYRDIRKYMEDNNFIHRQGSGYISNRKMADYEVKLLLRDFALKNDWFNESLLKIDVTNVGREYSLLEYINEVVTENEKMVDNHLEEELEEEIEL